MRPLAGVGVLRVKMDGIIACPFVTVREMRVGSALSLNETPSLRDYDATTTAVTAQNTTMKTQSLARKAIE